MALKGVKSEGFQEVVRTRSESPAGRPAEAAKAEGEVITEGQAAAVIKYAVTNFASGIFGRTPMYIAYARAVDAAVAKKQEELKGLLPPERLAQMEAWIKEHLLPER